MTQESKPKYMWTIPLTAYLQFWHKDINYNQENNPENIDNNFGTKDGGNYNISS